MKRGRTTGPAITFAAFLSLPSCADMPPGGPATQDAIARIARPEAYLSSFLYRDAYGSTEALSAIHRLGREDGCDALKHAVDAAASKYLPSWRQHMIAAYREVVPEVELAAAARKNEESARRTLKSHDREIWNSMGRRDGGLLGSAHQEVIASMTARARENGRVPPPDGRQLGELKLETVDFELCPDLQATIRLEDQ